MFFVGFDLSLRSSACVIWNVQTDEWHCISFAANKSQIGAYQVKENVRITICPPVPGTTTKPVLRYLHVIQHLIDTLCNTIPDQHRDSTHIMVEEYCVKTNQRKVGIRLHESGGMVKGALETHTFRNVETVPNTRWKACVIGKGNATKLDTVQWAVSHGVCVDLLTLFGYTVETLHVKNGVTVVPSPVQDLADATALCKYAHDVFNNCVQKPKKQRVKIIIPQSPEVSVELAQRLERKRQAQKHSPWANTEPCSMTKQKKQKKREQQTTTR